MTSTPPDLVIFKDAERPTPAQWVRQLDFEGAPTITKPTGITYQPRVATIYGGPDIPAEEWVVQLVGQRLQGTYNTKQPITDTLTYPLAPEWLRQHVSAGPGVPLPARTLADRLKARR